MKNKIYPIGNKILVKKLKDDGIANGIQYQGKGEKHGNSWFEVVAIPENNINPWIESIKVGDRVMAKEFDYDAGVDPSHSDEFAVLDVEPREGSRAGQVLAVLHV